MKENHARMNFPLPISTEGAPHQDRSALSWSMPLPLIRANTAPAIAGRLCCLFGPRNQRRTHDKKRAEDIGRHGMKIVWPFMLEYRGHDSSTNLSSSFFLLCLVLLFSLLPLPFSYCPLLSKLPKPQASIWLILMNIPTRIYSISNSSIIPDRVKFLIEIWSLGIVNW